MARRRLNGTRFESEAIRIEHKHAAVAQPTLTIAEWHQALTDLDSLHIIRLIRTDGRYAWICLRHKE